MSICLPPCSPALSCRHQNLRLASFTQHHNDQFDLRLSACENFEALYPKADTQELRSLIGRFGLSGPDAIKPMRFLSGGQKSRAGKLVFQFRMWGVCVLSAELTTDRQYVLRGYLLGARTAFALLCWKKPHIVILDEVSYLTCCWCVSVPLFALLNSYHCRTFLTPTAYKSFRYGYHSSLDRSSKS